VRPDAWSQIDCYYELRYLVRAAINFLRARIDAAPRDFGVLEVAIPAMELHAFVYSLNLFGRGPPLGHSRGHLIEFTCDDRSNRK
jgi:hypothetical protein